MVCCWKQLSPVPLLSLFFMALVSCSGSSGDDTSRTDSPKVTIDQSLKEISPLSAKNYVVSGKCDSSLQTKVVVTLGRPNIQVTLDCQADDTFTGEVDIRSIFSNPATITVTQSNPSNPQASGYSATSGLVNHIVPLVLDRLTSLGISNIASYRAIGNCESAFGDVRIKIEDPTLNLNISESIACSASGSNLNNFRADLDIARSLAGPITIQLAQGPQDLRTASLNYTLIASTAPSLSINPLGLLNSATAKAYAVTGTCNSSIQQQVTLTLLEDNQVSGMSDCQNNTFSIGLDAITLQGLPSSTLSTLTFQITHGNKSLDSPPLTNNIIHLKIDESALAILNLAHASTYVITGKCDPSLGTDNVEVEMGTGGIATPQTTSCDAVNRTFSESLDASDITEKPTVSIRVTHKGQEARATVQNNIVPLSINESALAAFNLNSSASYTVAGKCDSSLEGNVEVSVVGANTTDSATCNSDNTFTVDLNGSSLTIPTITFQATYGGKTVTTPVTNAIVPLSFNASLPNLNLLTSGDYTVDGKCDSSLIASPLVNVSIKNVSGIATQISACQSNSFSVSFNLNSLIPASGASPDPVVFQASYGSENVDSAAVTNDIVPLSIDTSSLSPLSLTNANSYTLTGSCDPSLGGSGTAKIGTPDVSKTWTCDNALKTFSVSFLDASGITSHPDATISVSYGGDTKTTTVTNNILRLRVDPPEPLTAINQGAYPVSGTCNPNISGQVKVTLTLTTTEETTVETAVSNCDGINNTFSTNINAADVVNNPFSMTVTHGPQTEIIQVTNEIVPLRIDTDSLLPLNLANAATYSVTGDCDSTITDEVNVSMSDGDNNTAVRGSSACTSGKFSVGLDVSAMRSNPVTISATHRIYEVSTDVTNEIVPLSFNASLLDLNLLTSGDYTVNGKCDSSLTNTLVSVSIKDISSVTTETSDCQNSSFSVSFDLSSLTPAPGASPDPVVFQASYGSENVDSAAVPNDIVPLSIDESALAPFNLNSSASYTVTGKCDSSIAGQGLVTLDIQEAPSITGTSNCTNNAFSVNLVASSVSVSPLTFRATYGGKTVTTSVTNETVPLSFSTSLPDLNLFTSGDYTVDGKCDSSLTTSLPVSVSIKDVSSITTETSDCQNSSFSVSFDLSSLTPEPGASPDPVVFQASYRSENVDSSAVPNDIIPLSIDESALAPFNLNSSASYTVTGKCDSSIADQGLVTLDIQEAPSITGTSNCTSNAFSVNLVASSVSVNLLTFQATYGGKTVTTSITNETVPLSFNTSLPDLNLFTLGDYTVDGKCDSSLTTSPLVSVSIKDVSSITTETSDCQNNSFSMSFDLSSLIPAPGASPDSVVFQASYGSENVDSAAVPNEIIPLSIDTSSLSPLSLTNANSYTLTGSCDPSLDVIGTATIGTPNVDKTFTCDDAQKTFSVSLNARGIISYPDATITVSYGSDTETTTVINNIPQLEVDNLDNPEPLTTTNQGAYPVSGTCNPNISEQVKVTITGANNSSDCDGITNTFSININATGVVSNPVSMTVTHGTQSEVIEVPNETNSLRIGASLPPINLSNAATYAVTGDCDSTNTDEVSVSMSDGDNTTVTESSSCVSGSFSVELDVSAMRSDTVDISASHGVFEASASVANNIVPLSFNELVETFSSSTASAYTLSGKCDSSLGGNVEVSVTGAVDITDSATCNNDNTFTVDLDGSSLTEPTITFQATYGGKTVSSNSIVNGLLVVRFQSISSKGGRNCALTTNGNVKCWGGDSDDPLILGNGEVNNSSTPVDVHTSSEDPNPLGGIAAISSGIYHACALTTDENVKCWGLGSSGRLGNGATGKALTPVDVHTSSEDPNPLSGIAAINSGDWHTCALTTDRNVKCWGIGSGRLGNGETDNALTPVDVHTSSEDPNPLGGIAAISSGGWHTCALTTDGNVKCWGYGSSGRLGNGATGNTLAPVDVHTSAEDASPLSGIDAISAGHSHTCALTTDGNVKCWGQGLAGRLGNGDNTGDILTPVDVHTSSEDPSPLSGIAAISVSPYHTCALTTDGNVKCWGQGLSGKLGNGDDTQTQLTPVDVHTSFEDASPLSGIAAISSGHQYTCALTTSGGIKCWGEGSAGQLGNGVLGDSLTPVDIVDIFLP